MSQSVSYATPLNVDRQEDCFFYHTFDMPGIGPIQGHWDIRQCVDEYLGRFDFRGKRVLDVGTASGFLTFEMEKRGAEVISFDMEDGAQWDVVPHVSIQHKLDEIRKTNSDTHRKLKNAYWFAHRRLGSKARVYYGDIYDLPGGLGQFDVAYFGMILTHLRDPFQALYSASRLVSDTIIITNQMRDTADPVGHFLPTPENGLPHAWWRFGCGCLTQMLDVLGFKVVSKTISKPSLHIPDRGPPSPCTALVAQRYAGSLCLTGSARIARPAA
jgi:hypothetical protein